MKNLYKSISSLNNFNLDIKQNNINISLKIPNAKINIKNKKNFLISLKSKTKRILNLHKKFNYNNTMNINLLKNPINTNSFTMRKTRNKTTKDLLNPIFDIGLFEKYNQNKIIQEAEENPGDKYLMLTSLYNLPKIKKNIKIGKKIYFNSHLGDTSKNEFYSGKNNSTINDKNIFNESLTSSNDKSTLNYLNLVYNNESKTSKRKNNIIKKQRLLSSLSSLMKNKFYSDTEQKLKDKITIKSFPSDHSLKDKVIHMKKVGLFWDGVFNYCVPLIKVKKFKAQRDLSERKKLDYLKLINNKLNYYDFLKEHKIYTLRKKVNENESQSKNYTSRIIS